MGYISYSILLFIQSISGDDIMIDVLLIGLCVMLVVAALWSDE